MKDPLADVLASFDEGLAKMADILANGDNYAVLAFDSGFAVNFDKDGKPYVVGVAFAESVPLSKWSYPVVNGKGEKAKVVLRFDAVAKAKANMEKAVADLKAAAA